MTEDTAGQVNRVSSYVHKEAGAHTSTGVSDEKRVVIRTVVPSIDIGQLPDHVVALAIFEHYCGREGEANRGG